MVEWFRFTVFTGFALVIGIIDFRIQKIPTLCLAVLLGVLLAIDLLFGRGFILFRLVAALGAFGLFYAVYKFRGGLGYGDVKYALVIGYYLGPRLIVAGLLCAVLLGLCYWFVGHCLFRWKKERRFAFGPWLGCGAIAVDLVYRVAS